jgi:hypothetical protein
VTTIGRQIGPYQIVALVGAGGMDEVYRARDTKLSRDVAIKILPPAVADDQDRLARFGREARVLASLNHPAIPGAAADRSAAAAAARDGEPARRPERTMTAR